MSEVRVTNSCWDFRGRRVAVVGELGFFQCDQYDNLDRVIRSERYDAVGPCCPGGSSSSSSSSSSSGPAAGNLLARSDTRFDARGHPQFPIIIDSLATTGRYDMSFNQAFALIRSPGCRTAAARGVLSQGCQGVSGLLLGRQLTQGMPRAANWECYETFADAQRAQCAFRCTGRGASGDPARPRIIAYRWNNTLPAENPYHADVYTGLIDWRDTRPVQGPSLYTRHPERDVHDFAIYDPALNAFWGADFDEASGGSVHITRDFHPDADGALGNAAGARVFCIVCESNEIDQPASNRGNTWWDNFTRTWSFGW